MILKRVIPAHSQRESTPPGCSTNAPPHIQRNVQTRHSITNHNCSAIPICDDCEKHTFNTIETKDD